MTDDGWFFVVVIGFSIGAFMFPSYPTKVWYAVEYHVPVDKVHVDTRPRGCDFLRAPLGDKECHYKGLIAAYNATGTLIGGDEAPRYSRDVNTNRPIVSYDGKTWEWAANFPDYKVESVTVSWLKINQDE